jgi:hypothetical protein
VLREGRLAWTGSRYLVVSSEREDVADLDLAREPDWRNHRVFTTDAAHGDVRAVRAPIPANAPSDVAPPSAAAAEVCAPGTTRSCMLREVTEDGYKYCHEDFELCRPDGLAFYPCGAYVATDSGYRERRPGGG